MLDLLSLVSFCAPHIAANTMVSLIQTESSGNPLVVNDNTNKTAYFPKDTKEAVLLSYVLLKKGQNLDFGLTQLNIKNARKFNLTLNKLFDPCENIKYGALILSENFKLTSRNTDNKQAALLQALSMYNSGNPHRGFSNGYVKKVLDRAKVININPNKY